MWVIKKGPGPGTYKEVSTRPDGIYPTTAFARTKSPEWKPKINPNPTKHDRVPYRGKCSPGPGYYDLSSILLSQVVFNKYAKSSQCSVSGFGTEKRKVFVS